uniref:Putative secreted protein n=1 Tax=Anopheles triannulatus TaxID=58253 RepID=A0A2M4B1J0_9DIPT
MDGSRTRRSPMQPIFGSLICVLSEHALCVAARLLHTAYRLQRCSQISTDVAKKGGVPLFFFCSWPSVCRNYTIST